MGWVDARRVVASVHHEQTGRDVPVRQHPRHAMGLVDSTTETEPAVTGPVTRRLPFPAIIVRAALDLAPESLGIRRPRAALAINASNTDTTLRVAAQVEEFPRCRLHESTL